MQAQTQLYRQHVEHSTKRATAEAYLETKVSNALAHGEAPIRSRAVQQAAAVLLDAIARELDEDEADEPDEAAAKG